MKENRIREPITIAQRSCDTMMRKFPQAADLPPKGVFHYHQGVFLSGMYKNYLLCKNEAYFEYMKAWVDSVVDAQGNFLKREPACLDDMQPGILLYPLIERTGDERYQKALDTLIADVARIPRNKAGGLWHKPELKDQMWLDGLYMGGPLCAEYARLFSKPEYMDLVVQQALLMEEKTKDPATGLLYHAWDESREADWADPETGLAPEFWGRSIGWVPVAVLDDMDFMEPGDPRYERMAALVTNLLEAVCRYQTEDGRWYQVVDKAEQPGNWPENSCSCLFTAALCKAVRKGIMESRWLTAAKKAYTGVLQSIEWDGEDLLIGGVCIGTGVGDYRHYCERPVSVNDLHGVGAFLLMCAEMQQVWDRISS